MALVSAAEARIHIPELTGTAEDTNLDTLIARVEEACASWCGYPPASAGGTPTMASTSHVRYLDGQGGRELVIDVWPVTAIASIYDDAAWTWGASSLVSSADYTLLDGSTGLVLLAESAAHGSWNRARRSIKATVTAGYTSAPPALKLAICLGVRHLWNLRRELGRTSVSGEGTVSVSTVDPTMLPIEALQALAPYRLPRALL